MRSEQDMMSLILDIAKADDRIKAVLAGVLPGQPENSHG